jgi:hypothetical protein
VRAILARCSRPSMFDLAAIGIAAACFLFIFALLYVLERV